MELWERVPGCEPVSRGALMADLVLDELQTACLPLQRAAALALAHLVLRGDAPCDVLLQRLQDLYAEKLPVSFCKLVTTIVEAGRAGGGARGPYWTLLK